jgi:transposase
MSRAAQECKGNNAVHVKKTAPHRRPDLVEQWPNHRAIGLAETAIWRKKSLTIGPSVTQLSLHEACFYQETPMPKPPPDDAKLRSLREQGAVNPRPQAVTDDLFAASEFFDPRDLVQVKYEMLRRVEKDGQSVTEAAAKFGFSRPSFYQAQSTLAQRGLAGLIPLKRGPKQARKLSAAVVEFIQQARQDNPSLSARDLARRIQERFNVTVHPRTIERGLARDQKKRRKPT